MAKRLLKDWTASTKIDSISLEAEVFFTRLIMKADDYGSYYANPKLLKAGLFPLRELSLKKIAGWVAECVEAKLILSYEVGGKDYIRIMDFGQRLRNQRNAFPHPVVNPPRVAANGGELRPEVEEKRRELEIEEELADAPLSVDGKSTKPDPSFLVDSYPNGQKGFEEIKSDELMVERLMRVVRNEGFTACDEVTLMGAVRQFFTVEEAKPDFVNRPRDDLKKHLVNWIKIKAKTLNQYG